MFHGNKFDYSILEKVYCKLSSILKFTRFYGETIDFMGYIGIEGQVESYPVLVTVALDDHEYPIVIFGFDRNDLAVRKITVQHFEHLHMTGHLVFFEQFLAEIVLDEFFVDILIGIRKGIVHHSGPILHAHSTILCIRGKSR